LDQDFGIRGCLDFLEDEKHCHELSEQKKTRDLECSLNKERRYSVALLRFSLQLAGVEAAYIELAVCCIRSFYNEK
jgi:hypothetical protein